MSETELAPCPFCGPHGMPHLASDDADPAGSRQYHYCKCLECECSTKGSFSKTDAIEHWNARHRDTDEAEKLDEARLKAACQAYARRWMPSDSPAFTMQARAQVEYIIRAYLTRPLSFNKGQTDE